MSNQQSDEAQRLRIEKEARRLAGIRERNEIRSETLRDSKQRMIGINVAALNEQMSENERNRIIALANGKAELKQLQAMDHLLEQNRLREESFRIASRSVLNTEWQKQIKAKPKTNRLDLLSVDYSKCSVSACQHFEGEDHLADVKKAKMKKQQKQWLDEAVALKREQKEKEQKLKLEYDKYLLYAYDMRNRTDIHNQTLKKESEKASILSNEKIVLEKKKRLEEWNKKNKELNIMDIEKHLNDPILCENTQYLIPETGKVRKDNFRGFSQEVKEKIQLDNEKIILEKKQKEIFDKRTEQMHAALLQKLVEVQTKNEDSQYELKKAVELRHAEEIKAQALKIDNCRTRKQPKVDLSWGNLREGYASGFGVAYY